MKDISRRIFLRNILVAPLFATACTTGILPTNTAKNFKEGQICVNEDLIRMQKVGILGDFYFVIPLNTDDKILNYGEPSFSLIPESESRISLKQVGEKGGEVIVDAPEGGEYFPIRIAKGKATDFSSNEYQKFRTNFKMSNIRTPNSRDGKISLETLTEKDLPFSDETLRALNGQGYVVNRFSEDLVNGAKKEGILPIYFTKSPIRVEYDRTKGDGYIRIAGETYVFTKGIDGNKYFNDRGFAKPLEEAKNNEESKEKETERIQTVIPEN